MGGLIYMFVVESLVAKVANDMWRRDKIFMLVFDLTVAEIAEVAGFLGGTIGLILMFVVDSSVAKVANYMWRRDNIFMLVFDLTVAEVAEVAGFSGGTVHWDICLTFFRCRTGTYNNNMI